ncbi:MAG: peptidase S10 [Parachlamydiaceae bacterium]|nr:peptidase S10 [Parachlamydiaceae bacterium]
MLSSWKYVIIAFSLGLMSLNAFEENIAVAIEKNNLPSNEIKEEFSETTNQVIIDGKPISYKAVTGNLLLRDDKTNHPKASIFFISYTKQDVGDTQQRPVTFCFNGGPGSSSVWLHLGAFGPKRVALTDWGDALPPYHLVDNEFSILDVTDLVFIDPISTGFSRAIPPEDAKKYHGVEEDIKSIADFIRLYITRFNRWDSPKFLAGESYGTTRAAGLAGYMHENQYLYVNGLVLISSILNFQSIECNTGNDLPFSLILPSYTATAWFHNKLSPDLQKDLYKAIHECESFVNNEYAAALFKGSLLPDNERQEIVKKLALFTGLKPDYVDQSDLRVDIMRFTKELLRDRDRTVGRFDSRFTGIDSNSVGEFNEYDPSMDAIFGAFTATFNHYLRNDLKWKSDMDYKILANIKKWDYSIATNQYLNVSETLRGEMTRNPNLRVFVANGYYDLAAPFFATKYTFNHLGLDTSLEQHVTMKHYDAGHMMYIKRPELIKLKNDLASYYINTLRQQAVEESGTVK